MNEKKLDAVTRLMAMVLVVLYTGMGVFLLKDKLDVIHAKNSSFLAAEEVKGLSSNTAESDATANEAAENDAIVENTTAENATGNEAVAGEPVDGEKAEGNAADGESQESGQNDENGQVENKVEAAFTDAPKGYFEDALFIGDSRTVGLMEYGGIREATYYATEGMSVYNIQKATVSTGKHGSVSLNTLLSKKKFSKVYLMLGINELGYDCKRTVKMYGELVEQIKKAQPSAIIYVEANLHVSASRSGSDSIFNNQNINQFNKEIAKLADNKTVFYLDVNSIFDDKNGNLAKEYTSDNTHVLGKYYRTWTDWIATQAIVK